MIGTKYSTLKFGEVEVQEVHSSKAIVVKFIDTGYEAVVGLKALERGDVEDTPRLIKQLREGAYEVILYTGESFRGNTFADLAKQIGISVDMLRSVSCGRTSSRTVSQIIKHY